MIILLERVKVENRKMDYSYPRLTKVFNFYNRIPHDVGNVFLVCCQHVMEPQMKMFERLIEFGFGPQKVVILGKAYSTNNEVLNELKGKGIRAIQPLLSNRGFDEEHKNNCNALLPLVPEDALSIILDDGAELIKTFAKSGRRVIFGVEQTSSGFRRLEEETLPFPVINVARSVTKLTQESPLVARHLNERILDYLKKRGIVHPVILVVGLGPIGESILEVFKRKGVVVEGSDIKDGHEDLSQKIYQLSPNAVVGATGSSILTEQEVRDLRLNHELFLISASSSDREFPVVPFRSGEGVHEDVIYQNIIFVNNGFPFSFMGNRYEMMPTEIEKTICLLGGSVMYGTTHNFSGFGLKKIPLELENLINKD